MNTQEIYEKYGDLPLKFHHLDEYAFSFQNILEDGILIRALVGGDMERMYRTNVARKQPITLKDQKHFYAYVRQYNQDVWEESYINTNESLNQAKVKLHELEQENSNLCSYLSMITESLNNVDKTEIMNELVFTKEACRKNGYDDGKIDGFRSAIDEIQSFLISGEFPDIAELIERRFSELDIDII